MITTKHVKEEYREAIKVMNDSGTNDNQLLKMILKLVIVLIKVALSNRTNTTMIMKKLGVELIQPKRKEEDKTETEE